MSTDSNKSECCKSSGIPDVDDPLMVCMFLTACIMIAGFCVIAFVSGPLGLFLTLVALAALGIFFAVKAK